MRWCQTQQQAGYPDTIFQYLGIPHVSFTAPDDIDPYRLELLYEAHHNVTDNHLLDTPNRYNDDAVVQKALRLLSTNKYDLQRQLLVAPIHSLSGLRGLLRAVFRLNSVAAVEPNDAVAYENLQQYEKKRRTAAFFALKSLNELQLEQKVQRPQTDRTGVNVRLGQVVQHRDERWRGVVLEWDKTTTAASSSFRGSGVISDDFSNLKRTTLTTKDYDDNDNSATTPAQTVVRCTVLLDAGDAYTMGAQLTRTVRQDELDAVSDPQLCRIRSHWTPQHFVGYQAATHSFALNALQAYQYPGDVVAVNNVDESAAKDSPSNTRSNKKYDAVCQEITVGVQEFAAQLNALLFDSACLESDTQQQSFAYDLFGATQRSLHDIVKGDHLLPPHLRLQRDVSPATVAVYHLKALLEVAQGVLEIVAHRRQAMECASRVQFAVGGMVRHVKYGFRGVVVAWDPTPSLDVSRWDGLQDVKNPMEQPFYHVVPDQNDCREVFGGERPMRYVCQENMELLDSEEDIAGMEVDLDPEWRRREDGKRYVAPAMDRFKHGEDLGDDGAFERCMERLEDAINQWQYQARQVIIEDATIQKMSQSNLLQLLQAVDNVDDAGVIGDLIKEMRKAHPDKELRSRLETGVAALVAGQANEALEIFESIVEQDPIYAEGWNKLGTTEFMLGKHQKSAESTQKALEIDPLHIQASNGLGMILFEKQEFEEAANCFRKSLELDPWSAVSTKLSVCIDLLSQMVHKDEIPF